jgi:hypothetical protein
MVPAASGLQVGGRCVLCARPPRKGDESLDSRGTRLR